MTALTATQGADTYLLTTVTGGDGPVAPGDLDEAWFTVRAAADPDATLILAKTVSGGGIVSLSDADTLTLRTRIAPADLDDAVAPLSVYAWEMKVRERNGRISYPDSGLLTVRAPLRAAGDDELNIATVPGELITLDNTGPRAGVMMTSDPGNGFGDYVIEEPGVYSGIILTGGGRLRVLAAGVTVRDSIFPFGGINNASGNDFPCALEYCDFGGDTDGSEPAAWRGDDGFRFREFEMLRCRVRWFSDAAKGNGGNARIRQSHLRVARADESDHCDAVQRVGSIGTLLVQDSNIDCRPANATDGDKGNACVFIADGPQGLSVVTGCLLAGGQVTVAIHDGGDEPTAQYAVTGNKFVRGTMGVPVSRGQSNTTPLDQVVWEGNVWDDDGSEVPLA